VSQVVLGFGIVAEGRAGKVVGRHCRVDLLIAIVKLLVLISHSPFLIIATAFISFGEHLGVPDLNQRACQFYKIYSRLNYGEPRCH